MIRKKGFLYELNKNKLLFLMIAPTLIFFFINSYVPMVGIYFAFTRFDFNGGLFGSPFVGLENFEFLWKSGVLWTLTRNTVAYNLAFIVFLNATAIFCAILLSEMTGKFFKKLTQSVMFLPYFISFVLLNAIAYNMFNYDTGFVNTTLKSWGSNPVDIYNTPSSWVFLLIMFYVWKNVGYTMVIYLATITGISDEYYEAATIDGANIFQRIWYITIPMLKPTFIILLLFALGSIMKGQFDLFYQLIGNNGILYNATDILDTYVFRSLKVTFDIGMATSAGLFQSIFGFVLIMTVNYLIKKSNDEYALF
ncbi:putative multiple-sugar transport system permease YteP [Paenibacillus allorhizoplanae]|uniref:Multiple-sugar transport system permease YteP n=1 Tax=Paenibacillus allorhizoplanae TaxID=2905648 RepID=A0ABM9C381_9BACL|nr:ABC transporter permease subunit [Paenibacillus allorhizoplanae]CAH1200364.1 putative multiple-sugar transport system permease YteP [Paenibacillus allorhizoplanae]